MLFPPRPWTNGPIVLYHGTVMPHARTIESAGVQVARGASLTDFGAGFYTTTLLRQAQTWAYQKAQSEPASPAVIALEVDRDALASLEVLSFVRGDFDAEDFWSLVVHCRSGRSAHGRGTGGGAYDVVFGPVAASWRQRLALHDVDQVSFHTRAAEQVLNSGSRWIEWTQRP